MKMQITVTDRDGWVLASHVFEITGLSDYQQATHYIRDRVRESLTKRSDESDLELARKLQASPEPPVPGSHTWKEADQLPGDERG